MSILLASAMLTSVVPMSTICDFQLIDASQVYAVSNISIVQQPEDIVSPVGETVTFSLTAEGNGELTYAWRYKLRGTGSWKTISGANTNAFSTTVTSAKNGNIYQCIVTDSAGNTIESREATLTVGEAPAALTISSDLQDQAAPVGETVTFSLTAEGNGELAYAWRYKLRGTGSWKTISGASTNAFSTTVTSAKNGNIYQCIVTDSAGNTVTSNAAQLIVGEPETEIAIMQQPENQCVPEGETAIFAVEAVGENLAYRWQYSNDGENWTNISDKNKGNMPTYSVAATKARDGRYYRCVITDGNNNTLESEVVQLTLRQETQVGDNLTCTYNNGTLTISGTGEMWSYTDAESSPFHDLDIDTLIIEDGVTVIGAHAFEDNSIQTAVLPESVFSIRYRAFWGNDNLDITVENIGCAIYVEALPETATVRGYSYSSAYHNAQGEHQTFICLDDDSFTAATNKIVLTPGETYQLNVSGNSVKYYSLNTDLVTVDNTGLVTAVSADYSNEAKVVAYDKQGKTSVYYFEVVNEESAPDETWRYSVISPASPNSHIFVPYWGQRISLNEDVAQISGEDYAYATGQFGTAPIISADWWGDSFMFYYTYDADIRPIKANTAYSEQTFAFTNEEGYNWEYTYYLP